MTTENIEKVELHCHIDGLLSPKMLQELKSEGCDFPVSPEELREVYPIRSMDDWLSRYFPVVAPCFVPKERLLPILVKHIQNLKNQGVIYTEIMLNGLLFAYEDEGRMLGLFRAFRHHADQVENGKIQVEFLVDIARGTPEKIKRQARRILQVHKAGLVCGMALAGSEDYPVKPLRRTFEQFRDVGLKIEIHAGELGGPESVWDALENGFPKRIGHGVAVFKDERFLSYIRENDIHIEMCPTTDLLSRLKPWRFSLPDPARQLGKNPSAWSEGQLRSDKPNDTLFTPVRFYVWLAICADHTTLYLT